MSDQRKRKRQGPIGMLLTIFREDHGLALLLLHLAGVALVFAGLANLVRLGLWW